MPRDCTSSRPACLSKTGRRMPTNGSASAKAKPASSHRQLSGPPVNPDDRALGSDHLGELECDVARPGAEVEHVHSSRDAAALREKTGRRCDDRSLCLQALDLGVVTAQDIFGCAHEANLGAASCARATNSKTFGRCMNGAASDGCGALPNGGGEPILSRKTKEGRAGLG
jgi:hypothetical protein